MPTASGPMLIHEMLLEKSNRADADGETVASLLLASGKDHLWNERPASTKVDVLVIHYISAAESDPFRVASILRLFCGLGVSAHYLVDRLGTVFRLVPEEKRAWHCGGSIMPEPDGRTNVNDFSIGIEVVATHTSGFTEPQYASLVSLVEETAAQAGRRLHMVGHEEIAGERAVRLGLRDFAKIDPGPLFDWERLRGAPRV